MVDNGDGTATLSGTPSATSGGSYPITITASNGVSPAASQSFTLTVDQASAITSANKTTFTTAERGLVHADLDRHADGIPVGERSAAERRLLRRQRRRNGHPLGHPGRRNRWELPDHLRGLQRGGQPGLPVVHPHRRPGAGHHLGQLDDLPGGHQGELHAHGHRLSDTHALRIGNPPRRGVLHPWFAVGHSHPDRIVPDHLHRLQRGRARPRPSPSPSR